MPLTKDSTMQVSAVQLLPSAKRTGYQQLRQYVKTLLRRCTVCRRQCGKPYSLPDPAPLPKNRVQDLPPFTVTGVDFTGALYVRDSNQETKVYIAISFHLRNNKGSTLGNRIRSLHRNISLSFQTIYQLQVLTPSHA